LIALALGVLASAACAPSQDCGDGSCGGGTGGSGGASDAGCTKPRPNADAGSGQAASVCDGGVVAGGSVVLDAWQQGMLDAQNAVRTAPSPEACPPLPYFTWNPAAQCVAQAWAERCRFEHNLAQHSWGENLAAATDTPPPADVVKGWADEVQDYDYATNTCAPAPAQCGHYTQLVWRNSKSVGCATVRCTQNSPFGDNAPWTFVVCDYAPPGNYVGQKPY
jgi:hypothetical protein